MSLCCDHQRLSCGYNHQRAAGLGDARLVSMQLPACKSLLIQEASVEPAEKAFARARVVDKGRQRLSQLARMHAHMCQGLGQHRRAIDILTEALDSGLSPDATVECLHLRGEQHPVSFSFMQHQEHVNERCC